MKDIRRLARSEQPRHPQHTISHAMYPTLHHTAPERLSPVIPSNWGFEKTKHPPDLQILQ